MVIRPRVMPYSPIDFRVGIAGTFSTKLPNCPVDSMFGIEKLDQGIRWVSVSSLWVGRRWSRCGNYYDFGRTFSVLIPTR